MPLASGMTSLHSMSSHMLYPAVFLVLVACSGPRLPTPNPAPLAGDWIACATAGTRPTAREVCGAATLIADDVERNSRAPDYMVRTELDFTLLLGDSSLADDRYGALHGVDAEWELLLGLPEGVSEAADGPHLSARLRGDTDSLAGYWARDYLGHQGGRFVLRRARSRAYEVGSDES